MTGEAISLAGAALKHAQIEAAPSTELTHHPGNQPEEAWPEGSTNHRSDVTAKSGPTGDGRLPTQTPRDHEGNFEPVLIPEHARRFTGCDDDKVIALYGRGLTVREIQGFPLEPYDTEASPDCINSVPDGIQAEITGRRNRPLDPIYPVVFFDALRVKIRHDGLIRNNAV